MSSKQQKYALAGEGGGGGLPKGLSLFRFILFSSLMLGAIYGAASLYFDSPPRAGDIPPRGLPAALWEPNPLLLPGFLALKLGVGTHRTPDGYVFSGAAGYALYGMVSIVFGIFIVGGIGWVAGEAIRREMVRRRNL
jgi:hypothetical protein